MTTPAPNADRRELIFARLMEVLATVPGVKKVRRNAVKLSDTDYPVIVLYDADETASDMLSSKQSRILGANLVSMAPELYILLSDTPDEVGTVLNGFRLAVIKAILNDDELKEIVGTNGAIRYEGCATQLTRDRGVAGDMALAFTYTYPLVPAKL